MNVSPADLAQWQGHVGRSTSFRQLADAETLRRFALASGLDPDVEHSPPALAHWAWFLDAVPDQGLGPDGHPKRGGLLPAITLPRRMFASSTITFEAPIALGLPAELTATVADVRHRTGSAGDLMFVDVERVVRQSGAVCVREVQTLVYREAGAPTPLPKEAPDAGDGAPWRPGPVNLFRFSAVTFNSHRIHYDQAYATDIEGYPALVVHGPFAAVKLAAFAETLGGRLAQFEFRAVAPLFVDQPVRFAAGEAPGEIRAVRCDGTAAILAKVRYR